MARFKLKLKSLNFISAVDTPAQETATAVLFKRAGSSDRERADIKATVRAVKTSSDELGLVFGWAFTMKSSGAEYFDLHGDNITEDDLLKVCAEYLAKGGKTDAMHDRNPDGEVVFAWPLTAEVAKSFGIETQTTGLMIAVKPSPEVFAKFKSGELTGWSIDGIGEREAVKSAPVAKQKASLVTDIVSGHQHQVCVYENGEMYVQSATMEGMEQPHSHGIVRDGDGALSFLVDSGHTHALAEGQPGLVIVAPADVVVVQASAKSTRSNTRPIVGSHTETIMSNTDADKTIADLTKRAQRLESIVKLAPDVRAHFDALSLEEQDEFLAKPVADRAAIAKAARDADEVVEYDGQTIRKSKNPDLFSFAKAAKARDEKHQAELTKQAEQIEKADITKRTTETLGQLAGSDETREFIVRSVLKSGGTAEQVGAALSAMKGWAAETRVGKRAPGSDSGGDPVAVSKSAAFAALEKGLIEFAKANKIESVWTVALDKFKATPEGAALKRAYDETV